MAKASNGAIDHALSEEVGRRLSPFTLELDHIVEINPRQGGFYFVYLDAGNMMVDHVPLCSHRNGRRLKPARFFLSDVIVTRLKAKAYKRWYYSDGDYVYPLKKATYHRLIDRFLCVEDPHPSVSTVLPPDPPDGMPLRKKPLLAVRPRPVTWEDVTPTLEPA